MIKNIVIRDFQAHKRLRLILDPHVTTIVGPSDVGKSAIIRALLWVATNKPAGDAFIREGCKTTSVKIAVDGQRITRKRGPGVNTYQLNGTTLKAFGNGVPDDIVELLNIGEICYQAQHDSPFWFSETAGEISRQLNQIVNLGAIDLTLSNIASALRNARARQTVIQERIENAAQERRGLRYIRRADANLVAVERLQSDWHQVAGRLRVLEELETTISTHQKITVTASLAAERSRKAVKLGEYWNRTSKRRKALEELLSGIEGLRMVVDKPIPKLGRLEKLAIICQDKTTVRLRMQSLLAEIKQLQSSTATAKADYKKLSSKFAEDLGKDCPLCGQQIKSHQ